MDLHGTHLKLLTVGIEAAEELLPAFNGDEQFLSWSGSPAGLSLSQAQEVIQETATIPGGVTWRIADRMGTLIGVAETAFYPSQDTGWIALLVIRRAFQGRGYGR